MLTVNLTKKHLNQKIHHYHEGLADLELDGRFFRPDSIVSRDLSVLVASMQFEEKPPQESLRWLDLMAGCGIRALRWGLEVAENQPRNSLQLNNLELWVNDADVDRAPFLKHNLNPLRTLGISVLLSSKPAKEILYKAYLEKSFFDLIDIDCFGSPNSLLSSALSVLSFKGILILSSTNGRSSTGHDRISAIRNLAASARTHPSSWEIAIRLQLASLARYSWGLGKGIDPLISFSDGRTFRSFVRITKNISRSIYCYFR